MRTILHGESAQACVTWTIECVYPLAAQMSHSQGTVCKRHSQGEVIMKILVVSNRKVEAAGGKDGLVFGEDPNVEGAANIRLAWATHDGTSWSVELIREPRNLNADNLPSTDVFKQFRTQMVDNNKDAVFYIHGYNKPFEESLDQAKEIYDRYQVEVILFSWPANPGGFILNEYKAARAIAEASSTALDRVLERMAVLIRTVPDERCKCSLTFLAHSLGCYLVRSYIREPIFTGETRIFSNVVLNAADVDNDGHLNWARELRFARRIYATINDADSILALSDAVNPDRLGNSRTGPRAPNFTYVDLSNGASVNKKHRHFESTADDNTVVENFFKRVLTGNAGLPLDGFTFDPDSRTYRLDD